MSNTARTRRIYALAAKLLHKTGRKKGRGLGSFSAAARKALSAIAQDDYKKLWCACTLDWMNPLEALLVTCVKWAFNRPIDTDLLPNDFCRWSLGRGTNTSPLCMSYLIKINGNYAVECESCILDEMGHVCWLPKSPYMKTMWFGNRYYYLTALLRGYKRAVRQYHYRIRKVGKEEALLRKPKYITQYNLFKLENDKEV